MNRNPHLLSYFTDDVVVRTLKNSEKTAFRVALIAFPDGVHEVEQIADGQTICILKPGGKAKKGFDYDFEVFLCNADKTQMWRISHTAIYNDIRRKLEAGSAEGKRVLAALENVYHGHEPDEVLAASPGLGQGLPGHSAEAILKLYKWIWGQEDCNYPPPLQGRAMSMEPILALL